MIATRLTLLALLSLTACAALQADPAPTCDGRHRRPANPHGSVLGASSAAAPLTPMGSAPTPPPTSFPSCP